MIIKKTMLKSNQNFIKFKKPDKWVDFDAKLV